MHGFIAVLSTEGGYAGCVLVHQAGKAVLPVRKEVLAGQVADADEQAEGVLPSKIAFDKVSRM